MKRFKIGDRARIVAQLKHGGKTVTIVALDVMSKLGKPSDYGILVDGLPNMEGTPYWCIDDHNLEPIIPLGSWDELEHIIGWRPGVNREVKENV